MRRQVRQPKPMKITFREWGLLVCGNTAAVYAVSGARLTYKRLARAFVMELPNGQTHELAYDHTNHERLDAHWQQFAA